MSRVLELQGLHIAFGDAVAVKQLDLHIEAGETLALVGESGSGKSATALSILRLLPPSAKVEGRLLFEGKDLSILQESQMRDVRGKGIGMVFQEPMVSLNPVLTVGDQIAETLSRHHRLTQRQAQSQAMDLLALVRLPQPRHLFFRYPHHLSGGQRQRIMIAIAVACRPRLLVADEPTTALDVTVQAEILGLLDSLKRELSMSMLLITHDLGLVSQFADRVHVLFDGQTMEQGSTAAVLSRPTHAYTRGLLEAALHSDSNRHYRTCRLTEIRKQRLPAPDGWSFELHTPQVKPACAGAEDDARATAPQPVLRVDDLHVRYTDRRGQVVRAVQGVSFEVHAGETLGLVGESGCGKSSLSKAIARLIPASQGRVVLEGTDLVPLSGRALARARQPLQFIFQDPYGSLNPRHDVRQMLDLVQRQQGERDAGVRRRLALEMLDQVGLPTTALRRYPHEFSGGQRQRLGIARALIQRPRIIICDEPVSALDVSVQAQILNLLSDLKERFELTYLFISHDLAVVRYFTDRVMVMKQGEIVEEGTHDQIWQAPVSAYTKQLIASAPKIERAMEEAR